MGEREQNINLLLHLFVCSLIVNAKILKTNKKTPPKKREQVWEMICSLSNMLILKNLGDMQVEMST